MRTTTISAVTIAIAGASVGMAQTHELPPGYHAAGWRMLFNGDSTEHWRGYRSESFPEKGWIVEDRALRVMAGGGGGDIITREQFENFELLLEWRVSERANSGIMYCVREVHGATWQTGPEFQILDDAGVNLPADDGHSAGALYDLYKPSAEKVLKAQGEYNRTRILMKNGVVEHWLNDVKVLEADMNSDDWKERVAGSKFNVYEGFGTPGPGHIALQDHGNDVWFRRIAVRDLDAPMPGEVTLFNGKNLDGWSAHLRAEDASIEDVWRVDNGVLICQGNPIGYIHTNATYDNFVLRLEWRFNPETKRGGNSGVLMRRTGDHAVWPRSIEAQLNSTTAGDIFGIGGFVYEAEGKQGRHTPRHTTAENPVGEWNEYEITVDRGRITMRINGEVVNRARNAEEVAGQIGLQSEGVEIHFRNVRLAPIVYESD